MTYSGANTITHRERMINAVNALTAGGGTPTAFAYAEVAAYLMGQTTKMLLIADLLPLVKAQLEILIIILNQSKLIVAKPVMVKGSIS